MTGRLRLFLFGDQTFDVQPNIRDVLKYRDNAVLNDFLSRSYDAVRKELYKLSAEQRDRLPRFTCVDDLMLWDHKGQHCIPLDMAVTCLYQLGSFMIHTNGDNYDPARCRSLGFCTGALAAAAVSCSRNAQDLVPLAVDAVIVAFRIGMRVSEVARRLGARHEADAPNESWAMTVPKTTACEMVERFCEQTTLPPASRPYVSAYSPTGVSVSGPPASLAQLAGSDGFRGLGHKAMAIHAPYHAQHLYSQLDVSDVTADLASVRAADSRCEYIPFLSSTGSRPKDRSFAALLDDAVGQILLDPIRWSKALEDIQASFEGVAGAGSLTVVPIATNADQAVFAMLKQKTTTMTTTSLRTLPSLLSQPSSGRSKPKLAIIGMSGRFPGAKDHEAFWELLLRGLDVHKPVPAQHWDASTHVDTSGAGKNTSATPYGCWLDEPGLFDARFFNISPREAPQIDPAQRLALMTAYEALEQAGVVADATPSTRRDRVGVFYGVTSNDWMETNSAQDIDTYFIPGGNRAFIPGRINYCFKFSGPSYAVDTACSSSLAAIHLACNSLWQGDVDTAIAGGTNVLTNPDFTAGLDRGHFLSRTGNCKTFDDEADGYCRGEGIGTVVIKRLEDALADKDPVLGVILGAYTNHSAESESITRPHVGAQRAIFSKILHQDAVDPFTVGYVEMHGTGTQAGDAGEMSSVLDTFAPPLSGAQRVRAQDETLYLGSAKSNIGHGEAASGVSSLIKVLLMMEKNVIPPHCGIKTRINRKFPTDLQQRNVRIATEATPWLPSSDASRPRRVFLNNFSAAGGNSALLLEEGPPADVFGQEDRRDLHLVACSAKNGVSLQGNLRSLLCFIRTNMEVPLGQLSYTTTARRLHHQHRVMVAGATAQEICGQLEAALRDKAGMTRPKSAPRVIFAFTGQGAQYGGMGRQLWEQVSGFRDEVCQLDQMAVKMGFASFLPVIRADEADLGGFSPTAVQLASVCLQMALAKLWASWGITPAAVVGHSLGEYAALNVAGVLSDADTVFLVGRRAELLQSRCTRDTHAMLVVKGSVDDISGVLGRHQVMMAYDYEVACTNSPVETVLAGSNEQVERVRRTLAGAGLKATLLKVPYAFHSSQIDPVMADLKAAAAAGVVFSRPRLPVLCPLNGAVVTPDTGASLFGPEYLARHSRQPVNMQEALLAAGRDQTIVMEQTAFVEIGPHPAISGMVRANLGPQTRTLVSLQRGRSVWQTVGPALRLLYEAGAHVRWAEYQRDFAASHKVLRLPAYSWDLKEYWIQYVHDWSLRKGDAPLVRAAVDAAATPGLESSTTIHRVVAEETDDAAGRTHMVVEADIAREDLSPLVQGHEVDGIPLCTPSVYTDMALTLGRYLLERYCPSQREGLVEVGDMEISKALILRGDATQQLLQAHVEAEWSSLSAVIKFMSFDSKGNLQEHARCLLRFRDAGLREEAQQKAAGVQQRIRELREGIATGATARFNRPMVYRAIRPLARFHSDYRAIDEVVLNSDTLEAASRVSFGSVKREGRFHTNPAVIDALTQSCGFTMNCNDGSDLDVEVFMNHGWASMQLFEPMDLDKEYQTYSKMVEGEDKLWRGDVLVFDGDRVVAYFSQIAIQGVPRRVLSVILSIESGHKSQKQASASKRQQAVSVAAEPQLASTASSFDRALSIVAEESGLALGDLSDGTIFSDVGVDSLLGLTISARFKEDLDVDIDFNAFFFDYPTVGHLRALFGDSTTSASASASSSDATTTASMTPTDGTSTPDKPDFARALGIIAEESGVAAEELTEETNFADAGIDSLLSLVIVSRFRDELGLDIQHESLLLECPTVADLRVLLLGGSGRSGAEGKIAQASEFVEAPRIQDERTTALSSRRAAVDECVLKYTRGFRGPEPSFSASSPGHRPKEMVVLVTGATGSLGSHLVYHLAQMDRVKRVICLNRENRVEAYARQLKAMRDKGIRFPEGLKAKLLVLQTDSSQPRLGLADGVYQEVAAAVTHVIHGAWPMSAKRDFAGFETQFQVMRHLIDLARDAAVLRGPGGFRVAFQLVSSIGVIGQYRGMGGSGEDGIVVPEERVDIDAVLPNGYGDAKWGCERMLDETLHRHPGRFRAMTVRLGQIAGSRTSGYWNPMEHFGFLVKSSQTLNALPDVGGRVFWTPVNDVAAALCDLVLFDGPGGHPVYHVENPVGQPWRMMNRVLADALGIDELVPFEEWVERVRRAPRRDNPASTLLEFLDDTYQRLACGGLVLGVDKAMQHSPSLARVGPVSEEVVRKYVHVWREIGFLR